MVLDPLEHLDLSDLPDYDADQEYQALLRAVRRQQGFGIIFVRCSPDRGDRLIKDLTRDLPRKRCDVLTLTEPLPEGDFFSRAESFLAEHPADVVFVQGLEHSLLDYEETKRQSGWTAAESRGYSWKGVPPILRNLNQQRDKFRNQLPVCFVFLVPLFLVRYLTRRAPDFFDWRSGVFEFREELASIEPKLEECQVADIDGLSDIPEQERVKRALEIRDLLENSLINSEQKFRLFYDLGLIQKANGDKDSHQKSWLKACEIEVNESKNLRFKGNIFSFFKNYQDAVDSYDKVIEINPKDDGTWFERGFSLSNLGQLEKAVSSYDRALEINDLSYRAWSTRGATLNNLGRYEEAVASAQTAIEIAPDHAHAWYVKGFGQKGLGQYEEAKESYETALRFQSDAAYIWYGLGSLLAELGRHEEAVSSYDKALDINPDRYYAWYDRGKSLAKLGRLEEAITSHDRALTIKPDLYRALSSKGASLNNLGRYEEAIEAANQAIQVSPEYDHAWYIKGFGQWRLGHYQASIDSLDKAVDLEPNWWEYWYQRGLIFISAKYYTEAVFSYDKALELDPDAYQVWYNRSLALGKLKRFQETSKSIGKALELNPEGTIDLYFDGLMTRFPRLKRIFLFMKKIALKFLLPKLKDESQTHKV